MTEAQEILFAQRILQSAQQMANITANEEDRSAATAAILVHALELATPELTGERRASLFLSEEA